MDIDTIKVLRRGDLFYHVDDIDDVPRVIEYRLACPRITERQMNGGGGLMGRPKTVLVQRTKFRGEVVPPEQGAAERVSVSDLLAEFELTPLGAFAAYVQARVRAEQRAQAKLKEAAESTVGARAWFTAWHAHRKVW